ncbi:hypothetical protein SAMN05192569_10593 [Parageobacillus thermantarcticus]|uniref:Uncharacterized protein n=1 Tax=Parageobacillus thermantarcticus TaxID=186116 RepID=A0A1I0TTV4_9BACL|nr:hypothetical protein SAMN05192569_10593 [Parageobacillus thermantarcticus]
MAMFENSDIFILKSYKNRLIIRSEVHFRVYYTEMTHPFEIEFEEVFIHAKIYDCR